MNQNYIYQIKINWTEPKLATETITLRPKDFIHNCGQVLFELTKAGVARFYPGIVLPDEIPYKDYHHDGYGARPSVVDRWDMNFRSTTYTRDVCYQKNYEYLRIKGPVTQQKFEIKFTNGLCLGGRFDFTTIYEVEPWRLFSFYYNGEPRVIVFNEHGERDNLAMGKSMFLQDKKSNSHALDMNNQRYILEGDSYFRDERHDKQPSGPDLRTWCFENTQFKFYEYKAVDL